jgi:hypothetical protein
MLLESAIQRSEQWMGKCAELIDGVSFASSNRSRAAVSLQHLCIEHHTGIHLLADQGVYGSAFALFRPQFEAYVRGAWCHFCASEEQLSSFLNGNDPPNIGVQILALEAMGGYDAGSLSRLKKQVWNNLNDFTHGGATQIRARNTADEISQKFKMSHVVGLLNSSATLALLGGVCVAAVVGDDALAVRLRDEYKAVYVEVV